MLFISLSLCLSVLLFRVDGADHHHQHRGVRSLPAESTYLLPRDNRDMGIVYSGSHERLRAVLGKMLSGKQQARIYQYHCGVQ